MGHNLKCLEAKRGSVASETEAIVNQIRMGWKAPPSSICPVCSMSAFPAESYMAADRMKIQVLPHGGKYKQDPPDYANESLRQKEAVEATLRTMREKRSELGVGNGTQTFVKIKETVAICL